MGTYVKPATVQTVWSVVFDALDQQSVGRCGQASEDGYLAWVRTVNATVLAKAKYGTTVQVRYPTCTVPSFWIIYKPLPASAVNQTVSQLYQKGGDYTCGPRTYSSYLQLVQVLNGGGPQLASLNKGRSHPVKVLYPWCGSGEVPEPKPVVTTPSSGGSTTAQSSSGGCGSVPSGYGPCVGVGATSARGGSSASSGSGTSESTAPSSGGGDSRPAPDHTCVAGPPPCVGPSGPVYH